MPLKSVASARLVSCQPMKCQTPFFIWFHHRSGSTHLSSLLDSHPQIASWGEFFYRGEAGAPADIFTRSGQPTEPQFLESFYAYRWDANGAKLCVDDPVPPLMPAVGFKLKYQQAETYPPVMNYLQQDSNVKAIHLIRTNLLSALVSAAMIPRLLKKFQRPNLINGESPGEVERRVELNPETVLDELQELESRIERGRQAMSGFKTLEITYEDLVRSSSLTCKKVLEFLNVDADSELDSRYVKIMPQSIRQSLSNGEAVADALQGTRYAHMLEED